MSGNKFGLPYQVVDPSEDHDEYEGELWICADSDTIAVARLHAQNQVANHPETGINPVIRNTVDFLVHAANCHEELLAALELVTDEWAVGSQSGMATAIDAALLAIAKAKGKTHES